MTSCVQRSFASATFGAFALLLAGCGGGGSGPTNPTPTPSGTPTATPIPTATTTPGSGGTPVTTSQVAFVSNRANPASDNTDLYKSNLNGSSVVRLTAQNANIDKPSVSSDGTRLVFQIGDSNSNGGTNNIELALVNTSGSGYQQLTNDSTPAGRPDDYNPVFSADGQFIYWTSTRQALDENGQTVDGVPHIWRMNGAVGNTGSNQIQLIREASAYPSLDRQGNLAYVALNQPNNPIAIAGAATGVVARRVGGTVSGQNAFDLALSPDGSKVAFSAAASGAAGIRIFNAQTGALVANAPATGTSQGGSAWSRDSQTLFFDSASGSASRRQLFSSVSPFTAQTAVSQDAASDNFSPAFLP